MARRPRLVPRNVVVPTPHFSPRGRTQSILLDEHSPIIYPHLHVRHKDGHPSRTPASLLTPAANDQMVAAPIESSVQGQNFSSDPYLRMLGSPLRKCIVTGRILPNHFLIRMRLARLGSGYSISPYIVPSRLLTGTPRLRDPGSSFYVCCWKTVLEEFGFKDSEDLRRRLHPKSVLHSLISDQIFDQLQLRALEEIRALKQTLEASSTADIAYIRRLTREEWLLMQEGSLESLANAGAILIAPQPNPRVRIPPQSPAGDSSVNQQREAVPVLRALPASTTVSFTPELDLSQSKLPVYNALPLFPSRERREEVSAALSELLSSERKKRWNPHKSPEDRAVAATPIPRGRASHAYLIKSDTVPSDPVDTVPLLMALWRLRLWLGEGWEMPTSIHKDQNGEGHLR